MQGQPWEGGRKKWYGLQRKDLELADFITGHLKCPVLQSDLENPWFVLKHGWARSLKAEGGLRKEQC